MVQGIPPYSNYLCRAPDITAVGTIFYVFSYDEMTGRDWNLSPPRRQVDALHVDLRLRVVLVSTSFSSPLFLLFSLSGDAIGLYITTSIKAKH